MILRRDGLMTSVNILRLYLPNYCKQWNFNSNEPWLIGEKSIDQIGCIHTCQGLELDYVGVIVGPDLSYKNNRVITDGFKRSPNDQSLKGFKAMVAKRPTEAMQAADAIIKNTYRTLMTRGMKGCYVYFCDKAWTGQNCWYQGATSPRATYGVFCFSAYDDSSLGYAYFGGRLCGIPN